MLVVGFVMRRLLDIAGFSICACAGLSPALAQAGVLTSFRNLLIVGQGPRLTAVDPLRGTVQWKATPDLKLAFSADYNLQDAACCALYYARVGTTQRPLNRQFNSLATALNYAVPSTNAFDRVTDLDAPLNKFFGDNRFTPGLAYLGLANLLWSPIHAKVKTGGGIVHADVLVFAGAGRMFHDAVQGVSYDAGAALELLVTRAMTVRLDVRDVTAIEEVAGETRFTNNVVATAGLALYLPSGL